MDTYVLAGTEYIHWNWTNLVERLECFDLIPEILLGEEMTSKIYSDTNMFFERLLNLFTTDKFYHIKVEWKDSYAEDEKTRRYEKVLTNFMKLLIRLYRYHAEKGRRTHQAAEKAYSILETMRDDLFNRLVELGSLSGHDLRSRVSNHNARFVFFVLFFVFYFYCSLVRYVPLFFALLVRESCHLSYLDNTFITANHWKQLEKVFLGKSESSAPDPFRRSHPPDDESESAIFPKLILVSLYFGETSEFGPRQFADSALPASNVQVAIYFIDQIRFWIDQQTAWIYQDVWLLRLIISIIPIQHNSGNGLAPTKRILNDNIIEVIRLLLQNQSLMEIVENDPDFVSYVIDAQISLSMRNYILMALCRSEKITRILDSRKYSNSESILDHLVDYWLTSGQYGFLEEIDARLRVSFTTSEVKVHSCGEVPPRRSQRRTSKSPVYLPLNFFRVLVEHKFGVDRLTSILDRIKEHIDQPIVDRDSKFDRRVIIWTVAMLCSSDLGCRRFGSEMMPVLIENADSDEQSLKATSYYAISLAGTCSLGAELLDIQHGWRVKKKRHTNGNEDTVDIKSDSLNDSYQSYNHSLPIGGSRDQLAQSIEKLCDFDRPLVVSILKQWSHDSALRDSSALNLTQTRTTMLKEQYRESRSVSDTTAMELAILRLQQQKSSPKKHLWNGQNGITIGSQNRSRGSTNGSTTNSDIVASSPLEPLPEMSEIRRIRDNSVLGNSTPCYSSPKKGNIDSSYGPMSPLIHCGDTGSIFRQSSHPNGSTENSPKVSELSRKNIDSSTIKLVSKTGLKFLRKSFRRTSSIKKVFDNFCRVL